MIHPGLSGTLYRESTQNTIELWENLRNINPLSMVLFTLGILERKEC